MVVAWRLAGKVEREGKDRAEMAERRLVVEGRGDRWRSGSMIFFLFLGVGEDWQQLSCGRGS